MIIPPSRHFAPLSLETSFNADRAQLDGDWSVAWAFGTKTFKGVPFALGSPGQPNVVLLSPPAASAANVRPGESADVRVVVGPLFASYLVFLHAVEDHPASPSADILDAQTVTHPAMDPPGNPLGEHVADYVLVYADGSQSATPIRRRFAVQQRRIVWGASPFAAVPAAGPAVFTTATEDYYLGRTASEPWGNGETRHASGREYGHESENLWLYALPNPTPDKPIRAIVLRPQRERCVIFGISATTLAVHPLRPGVRHKLRLTLPEGAALNALGELDTDSRAPAIGIDLGTVISARAALDYDRTRWSSGTPDVQPTPSPSAVVVEYAAHPCGRLYVATGPDSHGAGDLPEGDATATDGPALQIEPIAAASRPVRVRVVDRATRQPVAVRLHLHGEAGEYLPPRGYHRKVNPYWFEDNYAEFVNGGNQYAYVPGECVVDLPLGRVFVELSRGYEIAPIRTAVEVTPETADLTFELERTLPWRERGWVTADTHVHFLSPQVALLEGAAEGVNVVNLLASQWGEMFSNVGDFDGRTVFGARDFGGDGEFLVRVGTENRMQVLGHISLLGYAGPMIHPLCSGGPDESAIGDALEVTMAEWAERCIGQGGLVVMPHAPNPQAERAADIVLGLIHAVELMTFNPYDAQLNPYGLADWYRYQNLGYQIPLVGGSDKMSASALLGGIRTYAHLGDRAFTYDAWMDAVRAGNTFVTVGPLIEFAAGGRSAGGRVDLPATGGTLDVAWTVESVNVPIDQVEVVVGGVAREQVDVGKQRSTRGSASVRIDASTWVALRVRGSYRGRHGEIAAHTSSVQVRVGDQPLFVEADTLAVLEQIEGAIAYVDTLAPRPAAQRYKQLRATLEGAHARLHQRLHQQGVYHRHTPLHRHDALHEH